MALRSFFTLHNICATTSTTVVKSYRIGPLSIPFRSIFSIFANVEE